jgi:hypothetical protein
VRIYSLRSITSWWASAAILITAFNKGFGAYLTIADFIRGKAVCNLYKQDLNVIRVKPSTHGRNIIYNVRSQPLYCTPTPESDPTSQKTLMNKYRCNGFQSFLFITRFIIIDMSAKTATGGCIDDGLVMLSKRRKKKWFYSVFLLILKIIHYQKKKTY